MCNPASPTYNFIVMVFTELASVELQTLDISNNRIKEIPLEFRHMEGLEVLHLDNNPLETPPAYVNIQEVDSILTVIELQNP